MNYWLTLHWPPYADEKRDAESSHWVFLADGYQHLGRDLDIGDLVFIYETSSAPRIRRGNRFVPATPGRKGIIALAELVTRLEKDPRANVEVYEDGRQLCWKFHAKTKPRAEGYVPLSRIRSALAYKQRYGLRIRGGLRKLKPAQFEQLSRQLS